MDQATIPNASLQGPFRCAWSVVWRITGIPVLVFTAGLAIFVLIERAQNVTTAGLLRTPSASLGCR